MSLAFEGTVSDKFNVGHVRFSPDNGRTWSKAPDLTTHQRVATGIQRRWFLPGFVDPVEDILILFRNQGVLPNDNPLGGFRYWTLHYVLSRDGGRTVFHDAQIIQRGGDYSAQEPLPGLKVGRNATMLGDYGSLPIRIRTGEVLLPFQLSPDGGNYFDGALVIGRWTDDDTLEWKMSEVIRADHRQTTRGLLEPTIAEMPDGRVLMVLRASNGISPEYPGYRWFAFSSDQGRTWSQPRPWRYHNGKSFYSPSSCSQLLSHSNGRIYWIGTIVPKPPNGNLPRTPIVIGEVHPKSMQLIEETICVIDRRQPDDPPGVHFSNFYAREDRQNGHIVVHLVASRAWRQADRPFGRTSAEGQV